MIGQSRRMESPPCGDPGFDGDRTAPLQGRVFVSERTSLLPEFIPKRDGMLDHLRTGEQSALFLLHKLCEKVLNHAREIVGHCLSLLHKVLAESEIDRPFSCGGRYARLHLDISIRYAHYMRISSELN